MLRTVVVGYGLAGRQIHAPLIDRQPRLALHGVVARGAETRSLAVADRPGVRPYDDLDAALGDPEVDLVVIATPHDTHPELVLRTLEAGKACVVDKVMALHAADADRMIAARDRTGQMLSVFHNRRWDWDYLTLRSVLDSGALGTPRLFESSVCRDSPPRTWRGQLASAGTILHDWGAHLVDQALQLGLGPCRRLTAWITPAPWPGVDAGGHGRIVLEFDGGLFQAETSRICRLERPRWWVVGTAGGFSKSGVDPQELALRAGALDAATEPEEHLGRLVVERDGATVTEIVPTVRGSWDGYYANIAAHLLDAAPLAVTAEQARAVVAVLEAAEHSARHGRTVEGPWSG